MKDNSIKKKIPWPTAKAMNQIYQKHLWGGYQYDFYSGKGSHDKDIIEPYIASVSSFIDSLPTKVSVCDLGCGDFNIGKNFIQKVDQYFAIDIVKELIDRNKKLFKHQNLSFYCLDISKDNLPSADIVILRQVLQHLSNEEIIRIIDKLVNYNFLILTEHIPKHDFIANKDIISGQGIRLKKSSGVVITLPPFNLKSYSQRVLCKISPNTDEVIITTVYELVKR